MPRRPSDEPLRKITIDVYDSDVDELKALHGWGWSAVIRRLIRNHIRTVRKDFERDMDHG